jgi:hypothetical protein
LGRFLSQDPINTGVPNTLFLLDPQSLNSYAYSSDNPINHSDPSGLYDGYTMIADSGDTAASIADYLNNSSEWGGAKHLNYTASILLSYNGGNQPVAGSVYYRYMPDDVTSVIPGVSVQIGSSPVNVDRGIFSDFGAWGFAGITSYSLSQSILNPFGLSREWLMSATKDPRLINLINDIFRQGSKIPGGTAGAARYTALTDELVGGSNHLEKLEIYSRGLLNYLSSPGNLKTDINIAETMLNDLKAAQSEIRDAAIIVNFFYLMFNPIAS